MNLEIAWAAGVFEGDGSIVERYGRPRLQLIMCERESVDRFHRAVGVGKVYGPYGNAAMEARDGYTRRPRWFWLAEKGEAETALYLLTPHFSNWRRPKNVETDALVEAVDFAALEYRIAELEGQVLALAADKSRLTAERDWHAEQLADRDRRIAALREVFRDE